MGMFCTAMPLFATCQPNGLTSRSVIGLAPPNATASVPYSKKATPNILSHLLNDASLDAPIISLTLPMWGKEGSSITLGALPKGYFKVDLSMPLGDLSEGWDLPLSSVTLASTNDEGDSEDVQLDTQGLKFYPSFMSSIRPPHNLTEALYKHLHALPDSGWGELREFNCSYRGSLPNISFDFDGGDSISFSEPEYTLYGYDGETLVCLLAIAEFDGPPGTEDVLTIGEELFDKWHVVFDLGIEGKEASMGLIEREDFEGGEVETGVLTKMQRDQMVLNTLGKGGKGATVRKG